MTSKPILISAALSFLLSAVAMPQQDTAPSPIRGDGGNPIYKITVDVAERTTTAINYRNRSGSTMIDFMGTPLLQNARGKAKVETRRAIRKLKRNSKSSSLRRGTAPNI